MQKFFFLCTLMTITACAFCQQKLFIETSPMTQGRQMHGMVVLGDFIYSLGGDTKSEGYAKSIEKALINPDGSLGKWSPVKPLPTTISYVDNATLALNDILYVVSGWDESKKKALNTILWTRPLPNGDLENWQTSQPYPGEGVNCASSVATPGYIHVIGGLLTNNTATDLVWSAKIGQNGEISGWEQGSQLPAKLWYHCSGVAGGYVWVYGGLYVNDNKAANKNVYFAPILSDGKIGKWQTYQKQQPTGFYGASCTVSGEYLIAFCPRYAGGVVSNDVWYSMVTPQGLSDWAKMPADILSRVYMAIATDYRRQTVYISGGRQSIPKRDVYNNQVYYIKLVRKQQGAANTDASVTVTDTNQQSAGSRLSYMTQNLQQGAAGTNPGFITYSSARQILETNKKPFILYFYSNNAMYCTQQTEILKTFNSSTYSASVIFAEVETSSFPQAAQQYGVFRVPTWLFFNSSGKEIFRKSGVLQAAELDNYAKQMNK